MYMYVAKIVSLGMYKSTQEMCGDLDTYITVCDGTRHAAVI